MPTRNITVEEIIIGEHEWVLLLVGLVKAGRCVFAYRHGL
jgi:hypothetical protein